MTTAQAKAEVEDQYELMQTDVGVPQPPLPKLLDVFVMPTPFGVPAPTLTPGALGILAVVLGVLGMLHAGSRRAKRRR